jgi:hypothetical protein
MNKITLTDGELNLIEIALGQSLEIKKREARKALEFGHLQTLERAIDEIKQLQSLSNSLPVKI